METLTLIVFNRMLSMFNLKIKKGNLFYEYSLNYGKINFLVSILDEEGIQLLSQFLKLPYIPWGDTVEELFYSVANSPYFSKKIFIKYYTRFSKYKEFKQFLISQNPISTYKPSKNIDWETTLIDSIFNTKIKQSILNYTSKKISKKNIRNNFNGHLVLNWIPELSPGKLLIKTINEFKLHIEKRFDINFLEYIVNRPPNIIRLDFKFFYYSDLSFFEMENINELPF